MKDKRFEPIAKTSRKLNRIGTKKAMKDALFNILLVCLVAGCIYLLMKEGLKRHEQMECYQWQHYTETIPEFYLMGWQKAQCQHYEIEIKLK